MAYTAGLRSKKTLVALMSSTHYLDSGHILVILPRCWISPHHSLMCSLAELAATPSRSVRTLNLPRWILIQSRSALTFVLAPLPNSIFGHCRGDDSFASEEGSGAVDLGRFFTSVTVITGFALPLVLAHADVIKMEACVMSIIGGGLVYGTILAYSQVFKEDTSEF